MISFSPACAVLRLSKTNFCPALKTTTGKVTHVIGYKGENHTNFHVEKSDSSQVGANES